MIKMIKAASPARPKTNPERGLFSRKDFPLGWEVPPEGGAVAEDVSVIVIGPFGPVIVSSGVGVGEGTVDELGEERVDVGPKEDVGCDEPPEEDAGPNTLDTSLMILESGGNRPFPAVEVLVWLGGVGVLEVGKSGMIWRRTR